MTVIHISIREQNVADLVVIVPSRGRPHNVAYLAEDFALTAGPEARMIVAVDDDDPQRTAYEQLPFWESPQFQLRIGRRLRLGATLNEVATECVGRYNAIGFMGDDHRPRTEGWAKRVLASLQAPGGAHIAYGDDRLQGAHLPTAAFLTSDIVRALGWMALPGLIHLYVDNAWLELGIAAGVLRYLPDVVIEHMHPAASKAPTDATYQEANAPEVDAADKAVFTRWRADGLAADVERLRAAGVAA